MARKILGQAAGTGALATLYAVPTGRQATVSTVVMVNTSTTAAAVRIAAAKAGATDTPAQTLVSETLRAGQRVAYTEGWTLAATDILRANAPAGVSINAFGSEVLA